MDGQILPEEITLSFTSSKDDYADAQLLFEMKGGFLSEDIKRLVGIFSAGVFVHFVSASNTLITSGIALLGVFITRLLLYRITFKDSPIFNDEWTIVFSD